MKKIFLPLLALALISTADAQITMPAASTTQTITQDFGMGKIQLTYSRPNLKGRKAFKNGSELAPVDSLWRTGANAATKIKFTDPVIIGGKNIDTGTYVIYTIPGKGDWEVVINKGVTNWGTTGYKASEDVVRFKAATFKLKNVVETFSMQFANVMPESCQLHLSWDKYTLVIPVLTNIKDRLRAQVEKALTGEKKPYWQAANFYFEWDKDNEKALENVNKAIEASPTAFYMYILKAKVQKSMGDKAAAKISAQKCAELAAAAKNDDYVRQANELIKTL